MYCAQNNRIYCSDCNKSYIPKNYSNRLKSKGHNNNVMKKRCRSCNNGITNCNNLDLTCSVNRLSRKSNDSIKSEQTKEKDVDKYKNIDADVLLVKFRRLSTGIYRVSESIRDAKTKLQELYRNKGIT